MAYAGGRESAVSRDAHSKRAEPAARAKPAVTIRAAARLAPAGGVASHLLNVIAEGYLRGLCLAVFLPQMAVGPHCERAAVTVS